MVSRNKYHKHLLFSYLQYNGNMLFMFQKFFYRFCNAGHGDQETAASCSRREATPGTRFSWYQECGQSEEAAAEERGDGEERGRGRQAGWPRWSQVAS